MAEPIRILHVIRLMNHGGAESMIMNLYRNIDRTKVQFDFVQNSNEPAVYDEEIRALGGRNFHCPRYNGKNHFAYTKWWHDFFRAHPGEYPVVHGHLGSTAAIYLSVAKKYGCYTIAHSHNTGGTMVFKVFSYPTRYVADHFFACSKAAGISRYGKTKGNDKNSCTILKNAIKANQFVYDDNVRLQMRNTLGVSSGTLILGHVGLFRKQKNHEFLLNIFKRVHELVPESVLLLVGDGPRQALIQEKIRDLGLQDTVILTGPQKNVWKYYQAMDVFVMPSFYEGLPVALVEAQTSGLPCVVSDKVPSESAITDLVEFISLESDIDKWVERIMKKRQIHRRNMLEQIKIAGFDITSTAFWLERYYLNLVKENGQ